MHVKAPFSVKSYMSVKLKPMDRKLVSNMSENKHPQKVEKVQ